ncbi:MAG TPA: hypothetical protein VFG54_08490 [Prolixibacteraceae bacterium]|nr:hypothetical protein [Prolixibacteraceae bacterium]
MSPCTRQAGTISALHQATKSLLDDQIAFGHEVSWPYGAFINHLIIDNYLPAS